MVGGVPDLLFAPFDRGRLRVTNRTAVAPMTRVSALHEGYATPAMANYYARFARGGFALVIAEGTYTDQLFSQGYAHQPGLSDDAQARAWAPVVDAVHRAGGMIFAQLMHAGALSQFNRFSRESVGASAIQPRGAQLSIYRGSGAYRLPREIAESEIADAVAGFATAARRAREIAGFDGVEVHGANGYLLDQFLTSTTNHRSDRYGGPASRRVELTAQVATAVRKGAGANFPVGVRISQAKVNDFEHRWSGGVSDAEAIFGRLNDCDIDYLHVTEFDAQRPAFADANDSLTALARRFAPRLAVISNGQLQDPARARSMLASAEADIIALGKGALANPDWPRRVKSGAVVASFDPATLQPVAHLREDEALPDG